MHRAQCTQSPNPSTTPPLFISCKFIWTFLCWISSVCTFNSNRNSISIEMITIARRHHISQKLHKNIAMAIIRDGFLECHCLLFLSDLWSVPALVFETKQSTFFLFKVTPHRSGIVKLLKFSFNWAKFSVLLLQLLQLYWIVRELVILNLWWCYFTWNRTQFQQIQMFYHPWPFRFQTFSQRISQQIWKVNEVRAFIFSCHNWSMESGNGIGNPFFLFQTHYVQLTNIATDWNGHVKMPTMKRWNVYTCYYVKSFRYYFNILTCNWTAAGDLITKICVEINEKISGAR